MKVKVLMHRTTQPRMGRRLLAGEEYMLPREIAERIAEQGRGEIIEEDNDNLE